MKSPEEKIMTPQTISLMGYAIPVKPLALTFLVIQNSSLVLLMRYSRIEREGKSMYLASTAVFIVELVKLVMCWIILSVQSWQKNSSLIKLPQYRTDENINLPGMKSFMSWYPDFVYQMYNQVFGNWKDTMLMIVPSFLYAVQNNLLYLALSNLEAVTFQVTYQLKILTTALFSVWMLGKSLNTLKWFSLVLFMVGVILVQLQESSTGEKNIKHQYPLVGLFAVFASCISSGFAGVYFEKLLKSSTSNLWLRNIQLGLFGAAFAGIMMLLKDGSSIYHGGLFQGYDAYTMTVILNQAIGGLLVAVVMKYADNILKGFATSIGIIVSGVLSMYIFNFWPDYKFMIGTSVVMIAVYFYSL